MRSGLRLRRIAEAARYNRQMVELSNAPCHVTGLIMEFVSITLLQSFTQPQRHYHSEWVLVLSPVERIHSTDTRTRARGKTCIIIAVTPARHRWDGPTAICGANAGRVEIFDNKKALQANGQKKIRMAMGRGASN